MDMQRRLTTTTKISSPLFNRSRNFGGILINGIGGNESQMGCKIYVVLWMVCALLTTGVKIVDGQDVAMDPCEFNNKFVHCQCSPHGDILKVTQANCGVFGEAKMTSMEWEAIGKLENLQTLEFNVRPTRQLKFFIPDIVFYRMSNLTYFVLKMADVERIPSFAFANSTSLRDVYLEANDIRYLSIHAFAYLPALKTLSLRDNLILEVNRHVFVGLSQLSLLYLDRNHIRVIHDKAFKDLSGLEELDVSNNNLTVIVRDVFFGLKKLRRLDLRINFIEFLGDHVFAEMPMLEDVDLQTNKIISVSPTAFAGLKELGRLNLKENKIVTLNYRTFESLQKIYFLDLRSNELETLEEELISPIYTNLRNVSTQLMVEGNRFVCDCRILWIQELCNETDSTSVQYHLKATECNFFQRHRSHSQPHRLRQGQKSNHHNHHVHSNLNSNLDGLPYNANLTVLTVAPEETTSYAEFDSIRNVLDLDPKEMDCDEGKVTTLMSVTTHGPPTISDVLHLVPPTTDTPVLVKKEKRKDSQKTATTLDGNQFLSDRPDLNPSQSSRSSVPAEAASSAKFSPGRQITMSHHLVTLLCAFVAIFAIPNFLSYQTT